MLPCQARGFRPKMRVSTEGRAAMKLTSLLVAGAALARAALAPAGAMAGEVLDRVMSSKVMRMSTDPEYPPQSFLNAQNEFEGFDIAVGREIARRLGVEIEFVTPGWDV